MFGLGFGLALSSSSSLGAPKIIGGAITEGVKTVVRIDKDGNTLAGSQYDFGGAYYAAHAAFAYTEETIDGQAMVKIPKFYYRRGLIAGGDNDGAEGWWISDKPAAGFVLHPAFMEAGSPIDFFWLGKYQGVSDAGGTKVGSFGGATPLVSINISTYRSRCDARNTGGVTGFMMMSMYQIAAVQMLAMIEMGSTHSQATIGNGRVSQASATNVDAADVAEASYRGLVGLWGNVWQFLDGWRSAVSTGVMELWDASGNRTYTSSGVVRETADGNGPLSMLKASDHALFGPVFVCDVKAANETASTWPDRIFHRGATVPDRIALHGGNWNNGASAGLFALVCNSGPPDTSAIIGGRLAKV